MAGALAALVGPAALEQAAAQDEVTAAGSDLLCGGRPAICNQRGEEPAICGRVTCQCARTVNGNKKCVELSGVSCPTTDECDGNRDCASGEVSVVVSGCCDGTRRNKCVAKCNSSGAASTGAGEDIPLLRGE